MSIKAILFDMDGVLLDAKEWHYQALNKALEAKGCEPISRRDHLTIFDGLPTAVKLVRHKSTASLPIEKHREINNLKQEIVIEIAEELCKENPLHIEALKLLREEGYRMAVCSNSIRDFVGKMMKKISLDVYLDFFLSNQDVKTPKPSPEIYNTAMQRMGLKPEECVICEDNPHGLQAAKDSGAHVFQVHTINDVCYQKLKEFIETINRSKKNEDSVSKANGKRVVRRKFQTHAAQHK
ncbi:HAD superfamily hydrolase (TIGR01509 family) [Elusimicrobium posterum]|uniref:HAD family hydrolase n=1 Tax=Elusimicrobium posterum TaxID=3116653 RepID=UPI003C71FFF8